MLSSLDAKNVTVIVAFALLNLTLESLVVSAYTQYFPCHPANSKWVTRKLGLAFLQIAFWGIDYDNDKMYIGQGPGPRQEQGRGKLRGLLRVDAWDKIFCMQADAVPSAAAFALLFAFYLTSMV